jgi:hypothetical protein
MVWGISAVVRPQQIEGIGHQGGDICGSLPPKIFLVRCLFAMIYAVVDFGFETRMGLAKMGVE